MIPAPLHPKEQERLKKLESYKILFTEDESAYNDLVTIASQICETPIALVSFVTPDKQWFKAKIGLQEFTEQTLTVKDLITMATKLLLPSAKMKN